MVNILGFDTCLDKMFVALGIDGEVKISKVISNTNTHYHSAFLISTIREVIKEAGLTPSDIDIIATNLGPGSFTGIRACNTVARVFAQANGIKTIGISSLELLSRLSSKPKTLVTLDARKDMAYTAIFEGKKQLMEPKAVLLEEVKELIKNDGYELITDDRLEITLGGTSYQKTDADLGKILIEIANERVQENLQMNWRELKPLYIQPPPVTIKK